MMSAAEGSLNHERREGAYKSLMASKTMIIRKLLKNHKTLE